MNVQVKHNTFRLCRENVRPLWMLFSDMIQLFWKCWIEGRLVNNCYTSSWITVYIIDLIMVIWIIPRLLDYLDNKQWILFWLLLSNWRILVRIVNMIRTSQLGHVLITKNIRKRILMWYSVYLRSPFLHLWSPSGLYRNINRIRRIRGWRMKTITNVYIIIYIINYINKIIWRIGVARK